MNKYIIFSLLSILIASISQMFLKKSANKTSYKNKIHEYLNVLVIFAYALLFISTLFSLFAYKGLNLSQGMILESLGYILVNVFSYMFFKEKMSLKKFIGITLILVGIVVYSTIK